MKRPISFYAMLAFGLLAIFFLIVACMPRTELKRGYQRDHFTLMYAKGCELPTNLGEADAFFGGCENFVNSVHRDGGFNLFADLSTLSTRSGEYSGKYLTEYSVVQNTHLGEKTNLKIWEWWSEAMSHANEPGLGFQCGSFSPELMKVLVLPTWLINGNRTDSISNQVLAYKQQHGVFPEDLLSKDRRAYVSTEYSWLYWAPVDPASENYFPLFGVFLLCAVGSYLYWKSIGQTQLAEQKLQEDRSHEADTQDRVI